MRFIAKYFKKNATSASEQLCRLRAMLNAKELSRISADRAADELLDSLMASPWVVFSRPCEQATGQVVKYLARYSHRTA